MIKMNNHLIAKRAVSVLLSVSFAVSGLMMPVNKASESFAEEHVIQNPTVSESIIMRSGQLATWDCVWFGSYPQAEVIRSTQSYSAIPSLYCMGTSLIENEELYDALSLSSEWDANNDLTYDGSKYHRVKKSNSNYDPDVDYYYMWDANTYHYFKYQPVKWRVLRKEDSNKALLLADKVLFGKEYNDEYEDVTWEKSSLRKYLNEDFYNEFTSEEKSAMVPFSEVNYDNAEYGTSGGNLTQDYVSILADSDVQGSDAVVKCGFAASELVEDEARVSYSTTYAKSTGVWWNTTNKSTNSVFWWLRTPGQSGDTAEAVYYTGLVTREGDDVDTGYNGVRPIIGIDLANTDVYKYAGTVMSNGIVEEVNADNGSEENPDEDLAVPEIWEVSFSRGKGKCNIVYDENQLKNSSMIYNHSLATAMAGLSVSAYRDDINSIKKLYNDMNFENFESHLDSDEGLLSNYFIGSKVLNIDGVKTPVVLVTIRGTHLQEWVDNFNPGTGVYHEGFKRAADDVFYNLSKHVFKNKYDIDSTKILITGHSRGAAVANLVGGQIDFYGGLIAENKSCEIDSKNVFVYTFASPNGTNEADRNSSEYNNIYNIVNPEDFVTKVLLSQWGYGRFGKTYILPSKTLTSNIDEYNSFLAKVNDNSRYPSWNDSDDKYEPYPLGMLDLNDYVNYVNTNVTSVKEFYTKELDWKKQLVNNPFNLDLNIEAVSSLHRLYRDLMGEFMAKKDNMTIGDFIPIGETLKSVVIGEYGYVGSNTVLFFAFNQALPNLPINFGDFDMSKNFQHAHESEYYFAAMQSLTSEEMKSWQNKNTVFRGVVNCPVDIEIRNSENEVIGSIKNNTVDTTIEGGIEMDVDGDSKSFYIPSDMECDIVLTGNDNGKMDYSLVEIDADKGEIGRTVYQEVEVTKGESMKETISPDLDEFVLLDSEDNEIQPDVVSDGNSVEPLTAEVEVEGIGRADSLYNLMPGDYVTLSASTDVNNEFLGWYDDKGELITKDCEYSYSIKESGKFTAKFTDVFVEAEKIDVTSDTIKIVKGETSEITATVLPENVTVPYIYFESTDEKIVTCSSSGTIVGIADGQTTVKATSYDGKVTKDIKVIVGNISSDETDVSKDEKDKKDDKKQNDDGKEKSSEVKKEIPTEEKDSNPGEVHGDQGSQQPPTDSSQPPATTPQQTVTDQAAQSQAPAVGTVLADATNKANYQILTSAVDGTGTVAFVAPLSKKEKSFTVPATVTISGVTFKVTEIKANAFKNNKKLKSITIGENVEKIGAKAFFGCKSLKTINIKTTKLTAKTVGAKAFAKIAKKPTVKVPKSKKKAYKKWIYKKGLTKKAKLK